MMASDLKKDGIINDSYTSVVLGRRTARYLDPSHKVSRGEILEILREAVSCTPSAVNSQPWHFIIVDTDEGKQKLDDIMRAFDKDRVKAGSFAVVPCADRKWFDVYDELIEINKKIAPEKYTEEYVSALVPLVYDWYDELTEGDGVYLERSISFQTGLITMSLLYALRSHGLDAGIMDSWDPDLLGDAFGIDLDRYVPQCAIAVGKSVGPVFDNFRYEAEDVVTWG